MHLDDVFGAYFLVFYQQPHVCKSLTRPLGLCFSLIVLNEYEIKIIVCLGIEMTFPILRYSSISWNNMILTLVHHDLSFPMRLRPHHERQPLHILVMVRPICIEQQVMAKSCWIYHFDLRSMNLAKSYWYSHVFVKFERYTTYFISWLMMITIGWDLTANENLTRAVRNSLMKRYLIHIHQIKRMRVTSHFASIFRWVTIR